jgi:hypothetical protein
MFAIRDLEVLRGPVVLDQLLGGVIDREAREQDRVVRGECQLAQDILDLPGADRSIEWPEAHHDAPRRPVSLELAFGVDLAAVRRGSKGDEVELPTARQPNTVDAEQIHEFTDRAHGVALAPVADVVGPGMFIETCRVVRLVTDRIDTERRDLLDRERPRYPRLSAIGERLVEQRLSLWRFALDYVPEGDMRHGLVAEAAIDATFGISQLVIVIGRGHQPLPRECKGDATSVAGDPAPTQCSAT